MADVRNWVPLSCQQQLESGFLAGFFCLWILIFPKISECRVEKILVLSQLLIACSVFVRSVCTNMGSSKVSYPREAFEQKVNQILSIQSMINFHFSKQINASLELVKQG